MSNEPKNALQGSTLWAAPRMHALCMHACRKQMQCAAVSTPVCEYIRPGDAACTAQSLLLEDNDAAVAAGVNLMLSAGTTAAICQLQARP